MEFCLCALKILSKILQLFQSINISLLRKVHYFIHVPEVIYLSNSMTHMPEGFTFGRGIVPFAAPQCQSSYRGMITQPIIPVNYFPVLTAVLAALQTHQLFDAILLLCLGRRVVQSPSQPPPSCMVPPPILHPASVPS